MIDRLHVWDFQCHTRRVVDLDPHVTTIVGDNDAGKTALLRALRWAALNQPTGDAFVRHGATRCVVGLDFDGHTLRRKRAGADNVYVLDGDEFRAFGSGNVPEPIARLLNLGEINFQRQHDAPFWFLLSAGQVSRELNAIVNLDVIDRVLGDVASEVRRASAAVDLTQQRLTAAETELAQLDYVDKLNRDLLNIESLESAIAQRVARIAQDERLLSDAKSTRSRRDRLQEAANHATSVECAHETAQASAERANALADLLDAVRDAEQSAALDVPDTSTLDVLHKRAQTAKDRADALSTIVAEINAQRAILCGKEKLLAMQEETLRKMRARPCPLCGATAKRTS